MLSWTFGESLLLATSIVVAYTAIGGFIAITYTDWAQIVLLIAGVVFIGLPIAIANGGSPEMLRDALSSGHFEIGAWGWSAIIAMVISITMSFLVSMDSFTRSYAARDEAAAQRGPLIAVIIILVIGCAATWIGLTAAVALPDIESGDGVLPAFILAFFPAGLKGLILVGILAAVMSTADICILTVSANITRDFYQRFVNPKAPPQRLLRLGILTSGLIGTLAGLMAWQMQSIIDILLIGFTINGAALVIPTIAAVYWPHTDSRPAFWSICAALTVVLAWQLASRISDASFLGIDPLWPGFVSACLVFVVLHRHRAPWSSPDQWRGPDSKAST
ncbi:MAG: sodium:solute symporter family protein [Pseudomonadales bacterium]|nr:sodium:solute symporter family protein [Pseudomonadales bacterium]